MWLCYVEDALAHLTQVAELTPKVKDDKTLPEAFRLSEPWIVLAQELLKLTKDQLSVDGADTKIDSSLEHLRICDESSNSLKRMLRQLSDSKNSPKTEQYVKIVTQLGGKTVVVLWTDILGAIQTLVKEGCIQPSEQQKQDLAGALEALSKMSNPASTDSKYQFTHTGIGDQFNAPNGKQYVSKGGTQNNAETINQGGGHARKT